MKRPRLLLADDHKLFLAGLQAILKSQFEILGTVGNGRDFLDAVKKLRPDIALVDISMPKMNGIDALRKLKKSGISTKIVLLTMHREVAFASEAFRAGAAGYLLKDAEADELIQAIQEVAAGRHYLTPLITRETLSDLMQQGGVSALTSRQNEVLQLLTEGYKLKQIADELHIAISTVEFHKTEIMRRLGVTSTAELIRYSVAQGMASER